MVSAKLMAPVMHNNIPQFFLHNPGGITPFAKKCHQDIVNTTSGIGRAVFKGIAVSGAFLAPLTLFTAGTTYGFYEYGLPHVSRGTILPATTFIGACVLMKKILGFNPLYFAVQQVYNSGLFLSALSASAVSNSYDKEDRNIEAFQKGRHEAKTKDLSEAYGKEAKRLEKRYEQVFNNPKELKAFKIECEVFLKQLSKVNFSKFQLSPSEIEGILKEIKPFLEKVVSTPILRSDGTKESVAFNVLYLKQFPEELPSLLLPPSIVESVRAAVELIPGTFESLKGKIIPGLKAGAVTTVSTVVSGLGAIELSNRYFSSPPSIAAADLFSLVAPISMGIVVYMKTSSIYDRDFEERKVLAKQIFEQADKDLSIMYQSLILALQAEQNKARSENNDHSLSELSESARKMLNELPAIQEKVKSLGLLSYGDKLNAFKLNLEQIVSEGTVSV